MNNKRTSGGETGILVVNDDGVRAPGIRALAEALSSLGNVTVVAPDRERSAIGHGLTFFHPLRVNFLEETRGVKYYATDGTPTDCIILGLLHLMREKPGLVVSGINRGGNLGDDITYSGTVSAAMEGAIQGIPSMAVSLVSFETEDYSAAGEYARVIAGDLLKHGLPPGVFINVNVPPLPFDKIKGVRATFQGRTRYSQQVRHCRDPWGRDYFWIWGNPPQGHQVEGSDFDAIEKGMVSVTPLHLSMTKEEYIEELNKWKSINQALEE